MFSRRTGWDLTPNEWSSSLEAVRAIGAAGIDLTESNPSRVGLAPSLELLQSLLALPGVERYEPHPFGLPAAREAVVGYLRATGVAVETPYVALTASTSEAYSWLFKLLCDPGDRVLVPRPGYPLFEYLAGLEGVEVVSYPVRWDGSWHVDLAALRELAAKGAKAIVAVHPANPTGAFVSAEERAAIDAICAERGMALISDEVFLDYPFGATRVESLGAGSPRALTFVLGGLSKLVAAPQLKLGWIALAGPEAARNEAVGRLQVIADTFLSVGTAVQLAAPSLLAMRERIQAPIRARTAANLAALGEALAPPSPASVLAPSGGWYAVLRVPRTRTDDEWTRALFDDGVLVQPGWLFDFEDAGHLVVSLLPEAERFRDAAARIARRVGA